MVQEVIKVIVLLKMMIQIQQITINIQTNAGVLDTLEESPCSHITEMFVVFVLREQIT